MLPPLGFEHKISGVHPLYNAVVGKINNFNQNQIKFENASVV